MVRVGCNLILIGSKVMPHVNFGTKDEPGFDLYESPDMIAVRTRSRRTIVGPGPVPLPTAAEIADGVLVAAFPDAGVEVYQVPPATRSLKSESEPCAPPPMFSSPAGPRPSGTNEPVLYTENIYVRFKKGSTPTTATMIRPPD